MPLKNNLLKYLEILLFYSGLSLNIWIIFHFTFICGNDGPSHLYYSRILQYLFVNNSFLSHYFVINHLPVPNLTDHYLLAFLDLFFRSCYSQKIVISIYFIGFPLCCRYIIKKYNSGAIAASSFILPFTHCWLFYYGAYNFSISFTFLFFALYYYFHNFSNASVLYPPKKYFIFLLLVLLNYFTNGISFIFLGVACLLAEIYWLFQKMKLKEAEKQYLLKRTIWFSILWMPGMVMLYIVNLKIPSLHNSYMHRISYDLPVSELMQWFYNFKCLAFDQPNEGIYTHLFFYWLLITTAIAIYLRLKNHAKFVFTDIFLILFILTTVAYFIIPQNASVGLLSDRLFYYLIIFLLFWIALQKSIHKVALPLAAIALIIHAFFFFRCHYSFLTDFNDEAAEMQIAGTFVKPNSVVFPLKVSNIHPLSGSIYDILGIDKPLIVLQWYEPDLGWFAVNRTIGCTPKLYINPYLPDGRLFWVDNSDDKILKVVDYILFYGNNNEIISRFVKANLKNAYIPLFTSPDNKIHIYQLVNRPFAPPENF